MGDLKSKKLIYETRSWRVALLLGLAIWTSARLYYFMFYVIEKYVDSEFRFSSIYSFVKHMLTNNKS